LYSGAVYKLCDTVRVKKVQPFYPSATIGKAGEGGSESTERRIHTEITPIIWNSIT
jgi:hypothetical protein